MSSARYRNRLFEFYSTHLSHCMPDRQGVFVCPLCLRSFTREALDGPTPRLSIAHVVPKKMGGRLCTLTCTECNNNSGTRIEADLFERFLAEDTWNGAVKTEARLSGPFGNVGIDFV